MRILLTLLSVCITSLVYAQSLKPGFDKYEYIEMLKIAQRQAFAVEQWDSIRTIQAPADYQQAYRSPTMGLENMWDLWLKKDVAVISVRGTTAAATSWLANFYAAMVPAEGELQPEQGFTFRYKLSDDPKAAVHVGWLVATAYLSRDILPKIDSCYNKLGIKNFIITGHSQGGAICFLLTSHILQMKREGKLAQNLQFKTYCSAAPKPGNQYYAYSYEHMTRGGWGFNVVNTADWVPETPFSIQTLNDFNETNAFKNAKKLIKKQKFPTNLALRYAYGKLSRPAKRAQKNYQKYLGELVSKSVKKRLNEFNTPNYYPSNNYQRTGHAVILKATPDYYKFFPDGENIWVHHFIEPYMYLAEMM
jgi:predicted DNA binding CopG/RHH family protein